MTNGNPIRVALLGYGFASKVFHIPLLATIADLKLVAISTSKADAVARELPGVRAEADPLAAATADDVDLVVVATPNDSHAPLAEAALRAGKHVVIDKPFALNVAQARALADFADNRKQLLSVFHNRRWDSDFLTVKRAIEQGLVGRVVHFEARIDRFRPKVLDRWRDRPGPGSGLWCDLGPHLVDQTLQILGLPSSIQANLSAQRDGAATDDWGHVVLNYDGVRAVLHASVLAAGGTNRFTVHGDRGSIIKKRIDQQEAQILAGIRPGDDGWGADDDALVYYEGEAPPREIAASRGDQSRYYAEIAAAISGSAPNPVPPAQAATVMAVVDAAYEAASSGTTVPLVLSARERAAWN